MSASQSYLSSPSWGYDVVVATTQATINSQLNQYLAQSTQPVTYLGFFADANGNPTVQMGLDDLLAKTKGVNPFDVPANPPAHDPDVDKLSKAGFLVGLKLQMGLPPGVLPKDLPAILTLGTSAAEVGVNLFCKDLTIIQNTPASGSDGGTWQVWTQPSGTPWYFSTTVDLTYQDLSKELDTPYFNAHPAAKAALLAKLKDLGAMAFSLQQLVIDLTTASISSLPKIEGMDPTSNAYKVLQSYFVETYAKIAKAEGDPVLSVHAVADTPDSGTFTLTGLEREVSPPMDATGKVIANPTPAEQETATLDYLAAVSGHALPKPAPFTWAWVEAAQLGSISGVVAINRNTLAKYLIDELVPLVRVNCLKANVHVSAHAWGNVDYGAGLTSGQAPQTAKVTSSGATVGEIAYSSSAHAHDKSGLTAGELKLDPSYSCTLSFSGDKIVIEQHLKIYFYARWDDTSKGANIVDKYITDTYTMGVGQDGNLTLTRGTPKTSDKSQSGDLNWFVNLFGGTNKIMDAVKKYARDFASTNLKSLKAAELQSFVFPGAAVFTYTDASFSAHQDLVAGITYVPAS